MSGRLIAAFVMACLLVAACAGGGQISAAAAAKTAVTQVGGGPEVKVVSTRLSTFGKEAPTSEYASPGMPVWAVSLSGRFSPPSCGPATATPHPCPAPATTALVLIDAITGAWVMSSMPDPDAAPVLEPSLSLAAGFRGLPIDASLTPLSISHLTPAAAAALDLCVTPVDRGEVAGGALLASAHDVGRYMATNGNEPELQPEGPVWLFQLTGSVFPRGGGARVVDPVCMVRGAVPVIYAPYDVNGNTVPFPGIVDATLSLPPLAP